MRICLLCAAVVAAMLAGCGHVSSPGPLSGRGVGWGGCAYTLGPTLPAQDLGGKLGSFLSYGTVSGTFYEVKGRPGEIAFVEDRGAGGSAYLAIRTGRDLPPAAAIAQANDVLGAVFPQKPGTLQGEVGVGGPSPNRTVPAVLQTRLQAVPPYCSVQGSYTETYQVTFTERWSAKDFQGAGAAGSTLEHHWVFDVKDDQFQNVTTTFVSQGGDFPPQEAR